MSGISKKLMGTTAAGGEALAIEDVFSTYLFPSTSGTDNQIVNDIDLSGEGGMVWVKSRTTGSTNNYIIDTVRGSASGDSKKLVTNTTAAQDTGANLDYMVFNSDGFTSKAVVGGGELGTNTYYGDFASWTFRKAPRFFDVVTYTGTGSQQNISHNLDGDVGFLIVKGTSAGGTSWACWHRTFSSNQFIQLNATNAVGTNSVFFPVAPTSTQFTVGTDGDVNQSGATYVAYLFAHDPLGPSEDGSDGLIACGSFTTDCSGNATVDLGWEPQFVLWKISNVSADWNIYDSMRGFVASTSGTKRLQPNTSGAEFDHSQLRPSATGFDGVGVGGGGVYNVIYIAIRRGPMRAPESGTEVFAVDQGVPSTTPAFDSPFPVDLGLWFDKNGSSNNTRVNDRLRGNKELATSSTVAEFAGSPVFDRMRGFQSGLNADFYGYMFRRAPGFFDAVCYSGNDTARTIQHNLGVVPEMIWVKSRSAISNWSVLHSGLNTAGNEYIRLDLSNAKDSNVAIWNGTVPTDTVFSVGTSDEVNHSYLSATYIAYLFDTLPGVSKVGSYTGNGTSQTINCGFTSGARFILIKRTDSTGDWYVWDTARGIVTGNDPHLSLNTTAAEVTTDDSIDPDSSGFIVNQVAATNINVSSASYIFYAIA